MSAHGETEKETLWILFLFTNCVFTLHFIPYFPSHLCAETQTKARTNIGLAGVRCVEVEEGGLDKLMYSPGC